MASAAEQGPLKAVASFAEDAARLLARLDYAVPNKFVSKWPEDFDSSAPYLVTFAHEHTTEVILGYLARAGVVHRFTRPGVGTIWQRTRQQTEDGGPSSTTTSSR